MRGYIILIAVRILGRFISVRILPIVRTMRLPVRELLYVREILPVPAVLLVPEQNIDHQLLPDRRLRPGMKNRIKRLSLIETITEAREIPIVDRKRIQAHPAQVVDQQVEARLLQVPIVKADVQIVVQREAQADEVKVVPLVETRVPKEPIVLPVGEPVAPVVVAVAPVPAGVMFPEDKQKNVLLQEVREAVTQALPVHLKEVTVQEDNLFLYY
jgi:hypothetical protein